MKENYYTVPETAKMLKLSELTIRRYCEANKIEAFKIGRSWRITEESLNKFLGHDERKNKGDQENDN